jgi:DNA-binding NarL/FixJ family response regulator
MTDFPVGLDHLTSRQRAILRALMSGLTPKQLRHELGAKAWMVSFETFQVRRALGLKNNFQLGAWCERNGL